MGHQLLISHGYPPLVGPESIQSSRLVSALEEKDWNTTVITSTVSNSKSLDYNLKEYGNVVRAKSWEPKILKGIVYLSARSFLYCPDTKILWLPFALKKAREVLTKQQIDVIHSWSTPFTSHLVALQLKKDFNKRWIAHFSDPWVGNPYLPSRLSPLVTGMNRKWEREVIENADALVFTSMETVELVMSKYDDKLMKKTFVLPHTYDPSMLGESDRKKGNNERIVIAHVGNFYGPRTPDDFFYCLQRVKHEIPDGYKSILLRLVGRIPHKYIRLAHELDILDMVDIKGQMTYGQSLDEMKNADILLNIDAPSSKSVFLPSKLVEYIGFDKPIIALTSKEGTAARILGELGHLIVENQDHDTLTCFLEKICLKGTDWISFKHGGKDEYHPRTVAEKLIEIFYGNA